MPVGWCAECGLQWASFPPSLGHVVTHSRGELSGVQRAAAPLRKASRLGGDGLSAGERHVVQGRRRKGNPSAAPLESAQPHGGSRGKSSEWPADGPGQVVGGSLGNSFRRMPTLPRNQRRSSWWVSTTHRATLPLRRAQRSVLLPQRWLRRSQESWAVIQWLCR